MKKVGAFSLTELLVVITIIAILSTIAVPAYKSYIAQAKLMKIIQETEPYRQAEIQYYNKHGQFGIPSELGYDSAGGGCGVCLNLNYLSPEAQTAVDSVQLNNQAWPTPPGCTNVGSASVLINDSITGAAMWIYIYMVSIDGVMQTFCYDTSGSLKSCSSGWSDIMPAVSAACS